MPKFRLIKEDERALLLLAVEIKGAESFCTTVSADPEWSVPVKQIAAVMIALSRGEIQDGVSVPIFTAAISFLKEAGVEAVIDLSDV